jgi:dihydrofolate reductase
MRELILKMSLSLDGFAAGPRGEAGWMFGTDPQAKAWVLERVRDAGLHVMGSRTFRDMAAFWPTSTLPFAEPMNQVPKAVFSRQGASVLNAAAARPGAAGHATGPLQPGAQSWAEAYVASGDLAEEIARMKAADGKPIVAHGGAAFARSLVAANLVDEYALLIHPILLGQGLPVFTDLPAPRPLRLVSSTAFPGGAVAQVYRPA